MTVYALAYWALVLAVIDVIVVAFLPALDTNADEVVPVLVLVGAFLIVFALCALIATVRPSATRRPWVWLALAIPAVAFMLLNAPYLIFPITHPANTEFAASVVMVVAVLTLVVSGWLAFRDLRHPSRVSGARTRMAAAMVAAITLGAVLTGVVAGAAGAGGSQLAASPTTTATLVAEGTKFATTRYTMSSSDVLGMFIENRDSTAHSFDIDELDVHLLLPANGTVAVAIDPSAAGSLTFYCAIGGHRAAGMEGTIDVT